MKKKKKKKYEFVPSYISVVNKKRERVWPVFNRSRANRTRKKLAFEQRPRTNVGNELQIVGRAN